MSLLRRLARRVPVRSAERRPAGPRHRHRVRQGPRLRDRARTAAPSSPAWAARARGSRTCSRAPWPTSRPSWPTAAPRSTRPRPWPAGRAPKVVIGIAGELVKGFTTTRSVERKRPDSAVTHSELERLLEEVEADASAEAQRTITWETGPAQRRRAPRPRRRRRRRRGRLRGHQPGRLPGPPPAHLRLQRLRAARPPGRPRVGRRAARPRSSSRSSPSPTRWRAPSPGEQVGQSGALFIDVGGGTTDVALVRSGSVEGTRMFALGGRAFTKSLADRLDTSFEEAERIKIDHAQGRQVERRGRGRRDRRRGRRGLGGRHRARARGVRQGGPAARSHRALRRRRGAARDPGRAARPTASRPACPSRDGRRSR